MNFFRLHFTGLDLAAVEFSEQLIQLPHFASVSILLSPLLIDKDQKTKHLHSPVCILLGLSLKNLFVSFNVVFN